MTAKEEWGDERDRTTGRKYGTRMIKEVIMLYYFPLAGNIITPLSHVIICHLAVLIDITYPV